MPRPILGPVTHWTPLVRPTLWPFFAAGVKHKMGAMKAELQALRSCNAEMQEAVAAKDSEVAAAHAAAREGARVQTAAAKANAEEAVGRHISFIDRLLEDKAELNRQCEGLAARLRALEDKGAAAEARREEAHARELKRLKEVWAAGEKARKEQWVAEKTREIKEATVRGLEPDIQRLMSRHQVRILSFSGYRVNPNPVRVNLLQRLRAFSFFGNPRARFTSDELRGLGVATA